MTRSISNRCVIDLCEIATPLDRCVVARLGPISSRILDELGNVYDQAPVLDDSGRALGIIRTAALRALYEARRSLVTDEPGIDRTRLEPITDLAEVLSALASRRAALVSESDSTLGLVTISDLNKHPVRALLYGVLADLETALASFIESRCKDQEEWLPHLSEREQVQILGFWEITRRAGVDTSPLAGCMLTDLIGVVTHHQGLRTALGLASKNGIGRLTGRLPKLRNKVMHPVRPLVLRPEDAGEIRSTIGDALALRQLLQDAL